MAAGRTAREDLRGVLAAGAAGVEPELVKGGGAQLPAAMT